MTRILLGLIIAFALALPSGSQAKDVHPLTLLPAQTPVAGAKVPEGILKGRPVVVTFFASWCPPCTDEFKALNEVRSQFPENSAAIIGVNLFEKWGGKENPVRMARFLKRTGPQFPVIKGSKKIAKAFGNIERIPSLVVYDAAGKEVWRFIHLRGATKMSATAEEITHALKKAGAAGS